MTRVDFEMWKNTGSDHTDTFHRRKQKKKKNKKNKGDIHLTRVSILTVKIYGTEDIDKVKI